MNFGAWTTDWNKDCARIETGEEKYVAINRKNVGHLQSYANSFKDRLNFDNTMGPVAAPLRALSATLRQQAPAAHFVGSVAMSRMPQPDRVGGASKPSPLVAAAAVAAATAAATAAAAAGGAAGATSAGVVGPGGSVGVADGEVPPPGPRHAKKFRPCTECGHTTKAHGPSTTLGIVLALLSVPCPRTNDAEIRRRFSVWGKGERFFHLASVSCAWVRTKVDATRCNIVSSMDFVAGLCI